jgi:hypothetical protein
MRQIIMADFESLVAFMDKMKTGMKTTQEMLPKMEDGRN